MDPELGHDRKLLTRSARHDAGVALRRATRRKAAAEWTPPADRADPVAVLETQGAHRIPELLPVRYARMRASPLAFLRGAAAVLAADLAATPRTGLRVQSCGDCHLANFGSYATPEGLPVFDINDFDETLPAPFEWDIKRLATSLVLAGRGDGRPERDCRQLAASAVRAYVREVGRLAHLSPFDAWTARIDLRDAVESIGNHRLRSRARARLEQRLHAAAEGYGLLDTSAKMPRLREKPPLVVRLPRHDETTHLAFARYAATLSPERRLLLNRYRLQDVVFKVVGIGSVGTFCAIGLFATADGEPLLLQVKEAQHSVLEPFAGRSVFAEAGERVVTGQRIMQAASDLFLGWNQAPAPQPEAAEQALGERKFYVRRLKDSRLAAVGVEIEGDGLDEYAVLCGRTLARAHGRSADLATLAGYLGGGRAFASAVAEFAAHYGDQTKRDWQAFNDAIAAGRISASVE
jgi:uncharacterized protein (DUF2252 family)